jgi:hypothetical protein
VSVAGSLRLMRRLNASRASAEEIVISLAADFLGGGAPSFARVFDRKGGLVGLVDRLAGETLAAFRIRARSEAQGVSGAARVALGGLGPSKRADGRWRPSRGAVTLPDIPLHASQRETVELIERARRIALVCGRRWGKSTVIITLAVDYALAGRSVGIFAPTYRFLKPMIDAVVIAPAPLYRGSPLTGRSARSASKAAAGSILEPGFHRTRSEGPKISFVLGRRGSPRRRLLEGYARGGDRASDA